jgi:hypothetical protein
MLDMAGIAPIVGIESHGVRCDESVFVNAPCWCCADDGGAIMTAGSIARMQMTRARATSPVGKEVFEHDSMIFGFP